MRSGFAVRDPRRAADGAFFRPSAPGNRQDRSYTQTKPFETKENLNEK
jgi:hypothetical protein